MRRAGVGSTLLCGLGNKKSRPTERLLGDGFGRRCATDVYRLAAVTCLLKAARENWYGLPNRLIVCSSRRSRWYVVRATVRRTPICSFTTSVWGPFGFQPLRGILIVRCTDFRNFFEKVNEPWRLNRIFPPFPISNQGPDIPICPTMRSPLNTNWGQLPRGLSFTISNLPSIL